MDIEVEDYGLIQRLADTDVEVLRQKGIGYGRSWLKRGGVGAFMMLARKWDRIDNTAKDVSYDIFQAIGSDPDSVLDDIRDLRRYLLLVESEYLNRQQSHPHCGFMDIPTPQSMPVSAPRAG